jgi:hypothetical protein
MTSEYSFNGVARSCVQPAFDLAGQEKRCIQRSRFGIGLLFLVILLLAGFDSPAFGGNEVPIKGQVEGTVAVTPFPDSETLYRIDNIGIGNFSHLGQVETVWAIPSAELDLLNGRLIVASPEWTGTITAANGDQIFGVYEFPHNVIPFSPTGDLSFEADLRITGGTGRFDGATGQAVSFGTANIFTGAFTIYLRGSIATIGSYRK